MLQMLPQAMYVVIRHCDLVWSFLFSRVSQYITLSENVGAYQKQNDIEEYFNYYQICVWKNSEK